MERENKITNFLQPQDAWDKLSLEEKAEMMRIAVGNGITNLADIRKKYNEFAEGGDTNEEETQKVDLSFLAPIPFALGKLGLGKLREGIYKYVDPHGNYSFSEQFDHIKDVMEFGKDWDAEDYSDVSDELWAKYLSIPDKKRLNKSHTVKETQYRPSALESSPYKGTENNPYYSLPTPPQLQKSLVEETDMLKPNTGKVSPVFTTYNMGAGGVGKFYDGNREYRSFYDRWDLNPFNGRYGGLDVPILRNFEDVSMGIGTPVNVYNRLYLDEYYGLDKPVEGQWLPEVVVSAKKKPAPVNQSEADASIEHLSNLLGTKNKFEEGGNTEEPSQNDEHAIYLNFPNVGGGLAGAFRVGGIDLGATLGKATGIDILPFGHAGFILVDKEGNSNYYDYGRYKEGTDRYGVSTFGTIKPGKGNWRTKELPKQERGENDSTYVARIQGLLPDTDYGAFQATSFPTIDIEKARNYVSQQANDSARKDYSILNTCVNAAANSIIPFMPKEEVAQRWKSPEAFQKAFDLRGYSPFASFWTLMPNSVGNVSRTMRTLGDKTYIMNTE